MNSTQVMQRIRLFTAYDEQQLEKMTPLACGAAAYVENRIRGGADRCDDRLVTLAAAKAIYDFSLLDGGERLSSFKAGDVSLSFPDGARDAGRFYSSALECAQALLEPDAFAFLVT